MIHRSLAALALAVILAIVAAPAWAADTSVSYAWAIDLAVALVLPIVAALGGWLVVRIDKMLGLNIDAKHREALTQALEKAIAFGVQAAADAGKRNATIDMKSVALKEAVDYAGRAVPDALKHFGVGPDRLVDLVKARLPQ